MRYWLEEYVYKEFSSVYFALPFEAYEVFFYSGAVMKEAKRLFERLKILFGVF